LHFPSLPDNLTARIARYAGHLVLLTLMLAAVFLSDANMPRPAFSASLTMASASVLRAPAADPLGVPFALRQVNTSLLRAQRSASSLVAAPPPPPDTRVSRQTVPFTVIPERPNRRIITYTVQENDTPIGIAAQFGLKPETILWCNSDLNKNPELLQVGQVLYIPPVDGACHVVQEGDTLESIAEKYHARIDDIVAYEGNQLEGPPYTLTPGVRLVIPGGQIEYLVWTVPPKPPPRGQTVAGSFVPAGTFYTGPKAGVGLGNFIWPIGTRRISQYYWAYHRAIDLPAPAGTPIYAADGGTVIFAGWTNVGYGYLVVIDHGNGFTTWYAHQSQYLVDNGDVVTQGQLIGYVGSTGRSTGPHLHFEVRYNGVPYNPLSYLP
jgi:murein DD-endopeptidase MepM/ murein hydrolase activator NlpD